MRFNISTAVIVYLMVSCTLADAKVLVVVDNLYYSTDVGKAKVDRYVNDVINIDMRQTELVVWDWIHQYENIRAACYPLWQTLQQKYIANRHVPPTDQDITGAVFIGQLPSPKFKHVNGAGYYEYPHDYYFMDLWNQNTSKQDSYPQISQISTD